MRNLSHLTLSALAAACFCSTSVNAVVIFEDDFEANAVGTILNSPPPIGHSWTDSSTGGPPAGSGPGVQISGTTAVGTRSMFLVRPPSASPNGSARALSNGGALLDGNTIEVSWKSNVEYRFNGPMQVSIGHKGNPFGSRQLAYIQISDSNAGAQPGGGAYAYYEGPGHFQTFRKSIGGADPASEQRSSLNTFGANENHWDSIRAVLHIQQLGLTSFGGTMDLFIDTYDNPAGEVQIASGAVLETTNWSTGSPTNPTPLDESQLQLTFARGQSPGLEQMAIDDVRISVAFVPEPATMGLAVAAMGLLVRRSRK